MIKLKVAAVLAIGGVLVGAGAYQGAGARPSDPPQVKGQVAEAPKPTVAEAPKPAANIRTPQSGDVDEEVKKLLPVMEILGAAIAAEHQAKLFEEESAALAEFLKEHNYGILDPAREPADQERITKACDAAEKKLKELTGILSELRATQAAAELVHAQFDTRIRKVAGDAAPPPPDLDKRLKDVEQKLDRVLKALEARSASEAN